MKSKSILGSRQEIMDFIGASEYLFKKYITRGMPAKYHEKRWVAHTDNIDAFFKKYTNVSMAKIKQENKIDKL